VTPTLVGVEEYEIANQVGVSHHWWVIDGHLETFATPRRYVWPSELDLMARLAGLSLREREEDWDCRRFAGSPVRPRQPELYLYRRETDSSSTAVT
jgi:hypothetical protein